MLEESQLSECFEEPFEVLDSVLKTNYLSQPQVVELSKRFKESFLIINQKDRFYDCLRQYLKNCREDDSVIQSRLDSLSMELDFFMEKMGDLVSFYNLFGYSDPNKTSNSVEYDSDHSQDWDAMLNNKSKKTKQFHFSENE